MNARRFLIIHGVENRRPPGHWHARPFDLDVDLIPGGGHLGEADGYGRWPSVAAWCRNGDVRVVAPRDNV